MANITLPTTSVVKSGAREANEIYGATVLAGQFVYLDLTDNKAKLAIASAQASAKVLGMARNGGTTNQPGSIATAGLIESASGLTAGVVYVLSDTLAGAIMPVADLTVAPAGTWVTLVGIGKTTTSLLLGVLIGDVQAD